MKNLIITLATVFAASSAMAVDGPLWSCDLNAKLTGKEVGLVLATKYLKGPGTLSCTTVDGSRETNIPVNVKIKGLGLGVGYSVTEEIDMIAIGVGLVKNPMVLADKYGLGLSAGATLISKGVEADVAFAASGRGGLGFEFGLIGKDAKGFSASVQIQNMHITAR